MNINNLARSIIQRELHPDFPIVAVDTQDNAYKVIAFFIDAKKCVLHIDTSNFVSKDDVRVLKEALEEIWDKGKPAGGSGESYRKYGDAQLIARKAIREFEQSADQPPNQRTA